MSSVLAYFKINCEETEKEKGNIPFFGNLNKLKSNLSICKHAICHAAHPENIQRQFWQTELLN